MSLHTFLLLFISLPCLISAEAYVGFPFNEQLPNVARANQQYSFTLANGTYKSNSNGAISYSASNLPSWLSFDPNSRTFSGLPSSQDVANFDVTLMGLDSSDNSNITNTYSMVVSDDHGLHLSSDDVMFTQIAQYGDTNGNDGLVVKPGDKFNIKFDSDIFQSYSDSKRDIVAYYGRSEDRSSLPSWINFNSDDLSFSGTVPYVTSDIAPSIVYGFSFIASDYYGFAGAEGIFKLVVGAHQLSTSLNETIKVNGTLGDYFDIQVPVLSKVYLDNDLIDRTNISSVYPDDLPDYIDFNSDNFTLQGNFPNESTFDNFTIVVEDSFGNVVDLPYSFDAMGSVFTLNTLPNVNATRDSFFSYQLLKSWFTDYNATDISVNVSTNNNWLHYHEKNHTLTGNVPHKFDHLQVKVQAKSDFDTETKSFQVNGIDSKKTHSSSSSASSSTSSASSSASPSALAAAKQNKGNSNDLRKKLAIGLGVGIPCLLLLIAAVIILCCCARRRKQRKQNEAAAAAAGTDSADTTANDDDFNNKMGSPELSGPGFGVTHNLDDHEERAHQLASLNVLKLDEKLKNTDDDDAVSTSSSMTHVDESGSNGSNYFDAMSDKPMKSWRANDRSDIAMGGVLGGVGAAKLLERRQQLRSSSASLSTVNTEQLFSVRLVDDLDGARNSNQSSTAFMSTNSLNALLRRESSSGNLQRLDSDGNIVDIGGAVGGNTASSSPTKARMSRSPSSNLNIWTEENEHHHNENNLNREDSDNLYHTAEPSSNNLYEAESSSSGNLLAKFETSNPQIYQSSSSSSNYLNREHSDDSFQDQFKYTQNSRGEFQWSSENVDSSQAPSQPPMHFNEDNEFDFGSSNGNTPTQPLFPHHESAPEQQHHHHQPQQQKQQQQRRHSNFSSQSLLGNSANNSDHFQTLNEGAGFSNASLGKKAKLVEFNRKGSLRQSAYEPKAVHQGETAQIHDDDDSF